METLEKLVRWVMLRLLIVDGHEIVRLGMKTLFAGQEQVQVIGEAATAEEALERIKSLNPTIVVMEVKLPGMDGIEACRQITASFPTAKVIMHSASGDEDAIFAAIMAGASGYVMKQNGCEALVKAVEAAGRGESLLDPVVTRKVLERMKNHGHRETSYTDYDVLNNQESRILDLVSEGKTNKEIAKLLMLSEKTVKNYVSSMLSKLNFNNRAEAAAYAVKKKMNDKMKIG